MKTAVIFESTVEANCPQVEIDELRENTEEIGAALRENGYNTHIVPFSLDIAGVKAELERLNPDLIFNLTDSIDGKGNLISMAPMLCEHLGFAFTGAGSLATVTSCDKILSKQILASADLPIAGFEREDEMLSRRSELKTPMIIKSITEHASYGMFSDSVCATRKELQERLSEKHLQYPDHEWFAESYIDGREFNLSVIGTESGPIVLPPAEIVFTKDFPDDKPRIVDYTAKWHYDSPECIGTVRSFDFPASDAALIEELKRISLECWRTFGLKGYARVDFRVDKKGKPWVLEVNSNPFLTAEEGMGAAAKRDGKSFSQLIGMIVADALRNHSKLQSSLAA